MKQIASVVFIIFNLLLFTSCNNQDKLVGKWERYGDQLAGMTIEITNITFKTDSADINSSFYPVLNSVARVLNKYSNSTVMVSGHTDSTGSSDYNLKLSRERAGSVAAYLQGQGVKQSRFEVMGLGSSNPIASNSTVDGRALNRRVEIKIIPNK